MAKKSSSNRQRSASHAKVGATSKTQMSSATLVRESKSGGAGQNATSPAKGVGAQSTPAAASIVRDTPATPVKPAAKPTPKPAAKPSTPVKTPASLTTPAKASALATKAEAPAAAKRQDTRVARARATQRARQVGHISAENYSYVLGDLKLVAWLAGGAFAILIALTFFMPR